jgi:hypothetical protein
MENGTFLDEDYFEHLLAEIEDSWNGIKEWRAPQRL